MKFTYCNILGEETIIKNIQELKPVLEKPYSYWLEGTGDSSIYINDNERLIFFKLEKGFFIMQHPDYLAPKTNAEDTILYEHYIGGQELLIPSNCICNIKEAFEVLSHYIEKEALLNKFSWFDFMEYTV